MNLCFDIITTIYYKLYIIFGLPPVTGTITFS